MLIMSLDLRIGPNHHCMTYSIRGEQIFNMVFVAPISTSSSRNSDHSATLAELRSQFEGWDPV